MPTQTGTIDLRSGNAVRIATQNSIESLGGTYIDQSELDVAANNIRASVRKEIYEVDPATGLPTSEARWKSAIDVAARGIRTEVSETYATKDEASTTTTATGEIATLDGVATAPLASLVAYGRSVQDGSPTPDAPVEIASVSGRNLLDPAYFTQNATQRNFYSVSDGMLAVKGSDTQGWPNMPTIRLAAGYYTFLRTNGTGTATIMKMVDGVTSMLVSQAAGSMISSFRLTEDSDVALKVGNGAGSAYPFEVGVQLARGRTFYPFAKHDAVSVDVGSKNLSPLFSHDFTDKYSSTNPEGYWLTNATSNLTQLADGWAHFEMDNTSGTASVYIAPQVGRIPSSVHEGGTYTIMCEFRNLVATDKARWQTLLAYDNTAAASALTGSKFTITANDWGEAGESGVFYRTGTAQPSFNISTKLLRLFLQVWANNKVSVDLRLSLYAGEYDGPYVPYEEGTSTPIDLQGNELRSLPDGTHDELSVDSAGNVTLTRRVKSVDADTSGWILGSSGSTNSNGIAYVELSTGLKGSVLTEGAKYLMSSLPKSTGNWASATGREVACNQQSLFYRFPSSGTATLASALADMRANGFEALIPYTNVSTIDLGTIAMPQVSDGSTVWLSASMAVEATYTAWMPNSEALRSSISQTADGVLATISQSYATKDEVATLVRAYGDGVLVCKRGQTIGALINADGSFDVVSLTWEGGVPKVEVDGQNEVVPLTRIAADGATFGKASGFHMAIETVGEGTSQTQRLGFYDEAGTLVAYMQNGLMYVANTMVLHTMRVGEDDETTQETEGWEWKYQTADSATPGNLTLRWVG